jgi:hypothetical protein
MACAGPDGIGEKLAGADSGYELSPRQTGLKSTLAPDDPHLHVKVPTQPGTHRLTVVAGRIQFDGSNIASKMRCNKTARPT